MYLLISAILVVTGYIIYIYNTHARLKNYCLEATHNIDVHLKERANLIPNLTAIVKGAATHESSTHEKVTELRSAVQNSNNLQELQTADQAMLAATGKIMAVIEDYPDLKVNQNFLKLQEQLIEIEDEIESSRRYYNGTVRKLNLFIQKFPNNLLAKLFDFRTEEFIKIDYLLKENVKVDF